jgi:hypothetical protein
MNLTQEEPEELDEEEDTFDVDEFIDFSHDEPEDVDEPMSDDEDTPLEAPIAYQNTQHLRARLDKEDILSKVKKIISCMQNEGLNLPLFLDAVFYGDSGCHNDGSVQYQRTALMVSDELPVLLERWYQPPSRSQSLRGQRPTSGIKKIVNFAQSIVNREIDREMKRTANLFLSSPDLLSKEHLLGLDFHAMINECQLHAPIMWGTFRKAAYTAEQDKHNTRKNPDMVSLMCLQD